MLFVRKHGLSTTCITRITVPIQVVSYYTCHNSLTGQRIVDYQLLQALGYIKQ